MKRNKMTEKIIKCYIMLVQSKKKKIELELKVRELEQWKDLYPFKF